MIQTLFIEKDIQNHSHVLKVQSDFPQARNIYIENYGEVFNRKGQSFRLQKKQPGLILAKKYGRCVLPSPEGFGIGGKNNYYFSHILNCLYDCRYCFLQGMFRSAHYVHFVNDEDFKSEILTTVEKHPGEEVYFFSGYDGDSLALDSLTGFVSTYLPFFRKCPKAIIELRTKSNRIGPLLTIDPIPNCVIAFTFTPDSVSQAVEHKTPRISQRIQAMKKLANRGWKVGIRLDPLIFIPNFEEQYQQLFSELFYSSPIDRVHSVSLGPLRMPKKILQNMRKLYPKESLLFENLEESKGIISYPSWKEKELQDFCLKELSKEISRERVFTYHIEESATSKTCI